MPYKNSDIQNILPENEVHWKIIYCPKRRITHNEYRISIELKDKKRQYTCVSFEQLFELLEKTPIEKRCFYEHISRGDTVKLYLDYEYYKNHRNAMIDVNKALLCIQQLFINVIQVLSNNKNIFIHDVIVLESSSDEKESYHIIFNNENIRFLDNQSVYLFVTEVFRIILLATITHECLRNKNYIDKKLNNESNLMEVINAFNCVWLEWFACIDCKIKNMELNVCDVCNLFVHDQKGYIIPCVDLKVYGIEQDFRMFMCTKRGEERPLIKIITIIMYSNLASNTGKELSINLRKETLQKSLVTEPAGNNSHYVDVNGIWKWAKLIGIDMKKEREQSSEDKQDVQKKHLSLNEHKILARSEHEIYAEVWTKTYLNSIGSSGVIHSIKTGKHARLIMCNIRNMNTCKELHEDYINDSTIYVNLKERLFSVRCNHIPCNKRPWVWQPLI
ncbi:unnamed protein product [Rotaria sordida]|uniref:DNA-directed primase/polymerase protein n=1 Tax=Rotaria sordida TaxID=392033 RepID=A0A814HGK5_9BILA|nr:unnamed protein product [Rotaria sordida]CAF1381581.1 unnamed protein product [Rotaria sordida]